MKNCSLSIEQKSPTLFKLNTINYAVFLDIIIFSKIHFVKLLHRFLMLEMHLQTSLLYLFVFIVVLFIDHCCHFQQIFIYIMTRLQGGELSE